MADAPWHICDRHGFSTPLEELEGCPDCYLRSDIHESLKQRTAALERQHVHHHRDLSEKIRYLEPDLPPPFSGADLSLERLGDVFYGPGTHCVYDGRPAVVCVMPRDDAYVRHLNDAVLIRYLDGKRERILANPCDCAVGTDL